MDCTCPCWKFLASTTCVKLQCSLKARRSAGPLPNFTHRQALSPGSCPAVRSLATLCATPTNSSVFLENSCALSTKDNYHSPCLSRWASCICEQAVMGQNPPAADCPSNGTDILRCIQCCAACRGPTLRLRGSQMVREPSWDPAANSVLEGFHAQVMPASVAPLKLAYSRKPAATSIPSDVAACPSSTLTPP